MGRCEIVPNATRLVCGGNSAYGMVRVRDTMDLAHPEYDARVDLTWDATHQARITVNAPGGAVTENIDDTFPAAYQGLARITGGGTPEQQAYCRDMHADAPPAAAPTPAPPPAPTRDNFGYGWLVVPGLGLGTQYLIDRYGRHDLNRIPAPNDFGSLGTASDVFYMGGQGLFVLSYTPLHRRLNPTVAWIADGVCLGGALGFGIAAGVQPRGEGTPELSMATTLGSTCIPAMIYGNNETSRNPARFWPGFVTQLGLGGLQLGLGFGGVGARPSVSGANMYAPSSLPPGSRNVPGNPYEAAAFPGIDTDMKILGFMQAGGAVLNLLNYLLLDGNAPQVGVTPLPGGGAAVGVSGTLP